MLPPLCQCAIPTAVVCVLALLQSATYTFDDQAEGRLPPGWLEAKTGAGPGSVWRVVAHNAGGTVGKALAQTSSEGPNALFNLCVRQDAKYANVDLTVRVKAVSGQRDQGGGLVWRYQDANNYYLTRWNPLENNIRVYHVVQGTRTQLATADVSAAAAEWHAIRVVHRGQRIQCYLDGKLLLDAHSDTLAAPGAVGLWTKADAVTWFDDLSIAMPGGE